jgi:hypothetical protein
MQSSEKILNLLGVQYPQLAASTLYRRKPVSRGPNWFPPYQVRGRPRIQYGAGVASTEERAITEDETSQLAAG